MRIRFPLAVAALLALTAFYAPESHAAVAEPATITAVGWWTVATGVPKAAGGMQVAQDPTGGDMSVGAVKVKLNGPKLASALFVLNESSTSNRSAGAGMFACLTSADWAAANPGLWTDRPARDCSKQIQMVRSATQLVWTANLMPLLAGKSGTVGIMFIPGTPPPGSIEVPSISDLPVSLPSLPLPVIGGLPIPPPIPALPPPLPPVEYPELPASIAFPIQTGYMIDISGAQLAALGDTGLGGLSPVDDSSGLGSFSGDSFSGGFDSGLTSAPQLGSGSVPAATAPEQALVPVPASSKRGQPWGRAFGLFPLAVLIGVGGSIIRRTLRPET